MLEVKKANVSGNSTGLAPASSGAICQIYESNVKLDSFFKPRLPPRLPPLLFTKKFGPDLDA